jgi:hypothetical protein
VWGTSDTENCVTLNSAPSQAFFLVTDNIYSCDFGIVSAKARELGASALVIKLQKSEDMWRHIFWNGDLGPE